MKRANCSKVGWTGSCWFSSTET